MEALRLDTLAAQVVAWHNRHPLARRISAAQVRAIGYVVLPGMQLVEPAAAAPAAADMAVDGARQASETEPADGLDLLDDAGDAGAPEAADDADTLDAADAADAADAVEVAETSNATETAEATEAAKAAEATEAAEIGEAAEVPAEALADAQPRTAAVEIAATAPSLRTRLTARPALAPVPARRPTPTPAHTLAPVPVPVPVSVPALARGQPVPAPADAPVSPDAYRQPFRLAFSASLLEHTRPQAVARWAQRHARVLAVKLPAGAPVQQVPRDVALSAPQPGATAAPERPVDLLLRTATLEVGQRRLRLLVGPGNDPDVLAPRLWSLPRVALACLPLLLLPVTAGGAWWLGAQSARQVQTLAAVAPPATAAAGSVAVATAATAAAPTAPTAPTAAAAAAAAATDAANQAFAAYAASAASAADAAATAAAIAAAAQPPVDTEPRQGRVELPPLGPLFADERFEPTRKRRLAARATRVAPVVAAASQPASTGVPAAPQAAVSVAQASLPAPASAPPAAAPPTSSMAYALSTRPLRTSAEAEQVQAAMRTLLTLAADSSAQVQRVPVGDDWRVMGGPFGSRAAADKTRVLLLARGVKTELLEIPPAPAPALAAAATMGSRR